MNRYFKISPTLPEGETVVREFRCESKEKAMRLMKAKFADSGAIRFVSERDGCGGLGDAALPLDLGENTECG